VRAEDSDLVPPQRMHTDEVAIDEDLVRRLLADAD
jgi:hypothetical protein